MSYSQGIAKFYDLFDHRNVAQDGPARFLAPLVTQGSKLLEIGGGVGNTAFALAERGVQVTTLEPDAEMYAVLLARLAVRPEIQAFVSPIPRAAGYRLPEAFDVCGCFAVLHLLEPEDRMALVGCAVRSVAAGGKVVLEIPVVAATREASPWALLAERNLGSVRFEHHQALERLSDGWWCAHWKFRVVHDGRCLEEVMRSFRYYPLGVGESDRLLSAHGLAVDDEFGSFDRSPFIANQSRVRLVVAHAT